MADPETKSAEASAATPTPGSSSDSDSAPASASRSQSLVTGVLIVVACVAGGAVLWETTVVDRIFPRRFGVVQEGSIYRSAQLEANLVGDVLEDHNIRRVINLGVYKPGKPRHDAALAAIDKVDASHVEHGLGGDGTGDPQAYVEALTDMRHAERNGQAVLVHCSAGVNRTGAAAGLYRIFFEAWSASRTVDEMKSYDFDPQDNTKLLPYLDQHYPTIGEGLVERGLIEEVPPLSETFAAQAE